MIYFDMDGALSNFYENPGCLDKIFTPGHYAELTPNVKLMDAIRFIHKTFPEVKFGILSVAPTPVAASEKYLWLSKYFEPGTFSAIYIPQTTDEDCHISKSEYLLKSGVTIEKNDYLFDDYSRNCIDWEQAGGTAVKVYNGLNCRGFARNSFTGEIIDIVNWESVDVANYILSISEAKKSIPTRKVWTIPVSWLVSGTVQVAADTIDEAMDIAIADETPLPTRCDYIEGSCELDSTDSEYIRRAYNHGQKDAEPDQIYSVFIIRTGILHVKAKSYEEASELASHQHTETVNWSDDWDIADCEPYTGDEDVDIISEPAF